MALQSGLTRVVGASRNPAADALLAAAVAAFAALMLYEAAKIPPPFFDPLGSAALPRSVALAMLTLAALIAARALAGVGTAEGAPEPRGFRQRPDLAIGIFALSVAYVGAMDLRWIGFQPATILFLVAAAALLGRLDRRTLALGTASAVVVGFGATFLFTRFFFIDLPR
ncbi:tripartite tricarboxylate transporter TctB family protein [Rubrimonas sp.]|uniref:tripartite tricarboxylate transporter TctB family protein n=1 Tax=Rubrimonas sp. TaxID=2036015 RepID=UPI002FDE1540